jgi:uncharacterized membrane protein
MDQYTLFSYDPVFKPASKNFLSFSQQYFFWVVVGLALFVVIEVRLMYPSPLDRADIPLLFVLYCVIQVFITYIYVRLSKIGIYAHTSTLIFLLVMMITFLWLPITVMRSGLEIEEKYWQTHDFGNVNLVNAIFGLAVTGVLLVIR